MQLREPARSGYDVRDHGDIDTVEAVSHRIESHLLAATAEGSPMPTYTCWADAGTISVEARPKIVDALTEIHHDVAVAPRYFVQIVFTDLTPGSIYVAGQPADPGHVWIRADIRAGRTDEQKQILLDSITREVGQILDIAPEEVWVYICEIPGGNVAEYGRSLPHPGEEDQWFNALPSELQQRLKPLR